MDGAKNFCVLVKSQVLVTPLLPKQDEWLNLSNLDLLLPPIHFNVFFCYRKTDNLVMSCMVNVLKKALAQVLQSYYVLSGEIVLNSQGEPRLLCSTRGVDFVEAYADVELKHLQLYNPDASVEGKLVSKIMGGVLCVQVTELKCGSIVVACTFDHRIADAYSANMFLVSWAETSGNKPLSLPPSFQRSFLKPQKLTGLTNASADNMYVPISMFPPPITTQDGLCNRIYYIKAEHINLFQSQANPKGNQNRSKLESFSAFLWKIMAKGASQETKICKMGIVVDGRTGFIGEAEECKACQITNYFGNFISIPFGEMCVSELNTKSLAWVAEAVHKWLEVAKTKDHFTELVRWVESHRPEPTIARIYCMERKDEVSFVVSSGQRFPLSKIDFGWGKPIFGSYHFDWGGKAGYVMPMLSPRGNGDWVVYMHLMKEQLNVLEAEVGDVFLPLTFEYLSS